MENTVLASLEFYFKGNRYEPTAVIDLDVCLRHEEPIQHIYHTLASENGIGLYSYELDVMIMEPIIFSEPRGLAAGFLEDGALDIDGLQKAWQEEAIHRILQPIAHRHLGIENLDEHPALKAALIEAFQAS
ncbi:MAG: hypothetical protein COW19_02405 [Zetaproteobacteria bacterium CG12_big_fil_rev_8_21_14_0_65_55_1124]|nr:MAG: hypothetical protein AUJ58_10655 [Zetaproteobacteria bacterium CG1_02_55_237]PIS19275.1 MAG: hypothetical protein COT53_06455 [Zetaproteobacteria bacterium CG08_land_8_20_14_0_20_55_17]PIW43548.1 MAG: hypothetical protein COW19_02405 [Zetaproteobacteria bacterium CG12_big_fil_rev_8_21_14_0_65_55_1124]PIY54398.1 MAG: hypothetical protein COZ01_00420 [Zetaproteobacteria bacterium CG_4_10_14_0_8_um_filter_55_43]PIZ39011.1 MAG: hypothetical protein COY36_04245 [Zetaproteobacteria bacterium 